MDGVEWNRRVALGATRNRSPETAMDDSCAAVAARGITRWTTEDIDIDTEEVATTTAAAAQA